MASGIEIVGLALAVAPLVVSAIEHYKRGLQPFVIWAKYKRDLILLCDTVEFERAIFLNTSELLLQRALPIDRLWLLRGQPDEVAWSHKSVQCELRNALGYSYIPFCKAVRRYYEALSELEDKLRLDIRGTSEQHHNDLKHYWEHQVDRIKYAISKDRRNELRQVLKSSNESMRELAADSLTLMPFRAQKRCAIDFSHVRDIADEAYSALKLAPWGCHNTHIHNAKLRLERRLSRSPGQEPIVTPNAALRILFIYEDPSQSQGGPCSWKETDICLLNTATTQATFSPDRTYNNAQDQCAECVHGFPPSASTPKRNKRAKAAPRHCFSRSSSMSTSTAAAIEGLVCKKGSKNGYSSYCCAEVGGSQVCTATQAHIQKSTLKPIVNLCSTLQSAAGGRQGYLGSLDQGGGRHFGILLIRSHPRTSIRDNVTKLEELLEPHQHADDDENPAPSQLPHKLDWLDKRYLATSLALSLLQMYDTPWLGQRWGLRDIHVLKQLPDKKPMLRQPFVSTEFPPPGIAQSKSRLSVAALCPPNIQNKLLFDLGIMLVELCFQKSIGSLWHSCDLSPDRSPNDYINHTTAERLLGKISTEAGAIWGDVIRRCIRGTFDQVDHSFHKDDFRQAVLQNVVMPLEDDLRTFCGGNLPEEES